ncbi:aspartyl-tRNA synthetase [Bacillus mesophilus]|uniref:Aspartyl-tRNA synthetase n=1 Tax=Bacillus mesophilus TaxID=1808955 RepID=A0A6M0Q6P1_9BACI|nr:aspartyl-tRNA synthetase [Bacillus mesophilus]NEY71409.1 aspartyl-tRNA synthetase [Bacillus mesophilus]
MLLKISLSILIVILITISLIWFIAEKSNSYSEPNEALLAIDKDLLLYPAYKRNGNALFFFIKDKNHLGATYVKKGLFGWKSGMLTYSPMDHKRNYEKLNGYQGHSDNLIYGLIKIKDGDEKYIKIDENNANLLSLEMLPSYIVEEYQLEDIYIWYFESDTALEVGEIKLMNKNTDEVIDTIDL